MAYENFFYEPGIFQLFSTIRNFREWGFQKHFVRRNFWEFTWKFAKFCEFAKIYSRNNLLKVARIHIDNPMYLTNNLTTLFKTVTIVISLIIQHALNRFLTNHKALFKCSKTFETSLSNHDKLISTHCVGVSVSGVFLVHIFPHIWAKYGKMRTKKTRNTNTFYAVKIMKLGRFKALPCNKIYRS